MVLEVEPFDARQRARTVKILAIDQGTSATKAVVFGEDGDIVASAEAAVTPQAVRTVASNRTPSSCGNRCARPDGRPSPGRGGV